MGAGDGLRTISAQFKADSRELTAKASLVVRKVAQDTEADAKNFAPVDTGNLRNSITTRVSNGGLTAGVVATASYAQYVENGTARQGAQPFMQPAVDRQAPVFREAMGRLAQ